MRKNVHEDVKVRQDKDVTVVSLVWNSCIKMDLSNIYIYTDNTDAVNDTQLK